MKLYIKQQVFSWRDKFYVKDENGRDCYYAQGEIFSWGRNLHIYNASGQEVATIRQKLMTWLPRYLIEIGGYTYTLVRELTFFRPRFHLEGFAWSMEGNFLEHDYSLIEGEYIIMRMTKEWFTWGDSYQLDISQPKYELLCLCTALAIDCMNADSQRN